MYLKQGVSPLKSDPIKMWEELKLIYPTMYKLAIKYLSVVATSVPSERLFSKAGATVSQQRNRLLGKRLEKLLFLGGCTEADWGYN